MDLGPVFVFIAGGIFSAVLGAVVEDYRSKRDHTRELERLRAGKAMDIRLADIEATRYEVQTTLLTEAYRGQGPGEVTPFSVPDIPRPATGAVAVEYLDSATLEDYEIFLSENVDRPDDEGLGASAIQRVATISLDIDVALDTARECVLSGLPVPMIAPRELKNIRQRRNPTMFGGPRDERSYAGPTSRPRRSRD